MKENVAISTTLYQPSEMPLHQIAMNGKIFSSIHLNALYLDLFRYLNDKGEAINELKIQLVDWTSRINYVLEGDVASIKFKEIDNHNLIEMIQNRFDETDEMLDLTSHSTALKIPEEFIINNETTFNKDTFDFDAFIKSLHKMIFSCWSTPPKK